MCRSVAPLSAALVIAATVFTTEVRAASTQAETQPTPMTCHFEHLSVGEVWSPQRGYQRFVNEDEAWMLCDKHTYTADAKLFGFSRAEWDTLSASQTFECLDTDAERTHLTCRPAPPSAKKDE